MHKYTRTEYEDASLNDEGLVQKNVRDASRVRLSAADQRPAGQIIGGAAARFFTSATRFQVPALKKSNRATWLQQAWARSSLQDPLERLVGHYCWTRNLLKGQIRRESPTKTSKHENMIT
jgi:hypothetical protein